MDVGKTDEKKTNRRSLCFSFSLTPDVHMVDKTGNASFKLGGMEYRSYGFELKEERTNESEHCVNRSGKRTSYKRGAPGATKRKNRYCLNCTAGRNMGR